ncbi:hypothetical protein IMZ11_12365 [Microtetraspora sp. AC03309]|uniref:hypothetical protein n=1 Tax=Microtetraspora sp. AC03309 TaxID=2779376 RepID=UPI001E5C9D5C|nr:hypothetical protein [Microtetraspora sp. AC03309]MCC5576427.1 hypothetical protein [Microtetraspora sp. AC03309]
MSKTTPGEYRDFEFWVFDVSKGILLAEMTDVIKAMEPRSRPRWLSAVLDDMCLHAAISDLLFSLDDWVDGHTEEFIALVEAACERLRRRGTITAEEAAAWLVSDDLHVIWRGADEVRVEPVVAFGEAIVAIIRGIHPPAPPGHQWYFGTYAAGGPITTVVIRGPG